MQTKNQYQKPTRLYRVYTECFSAIRFRGREGREYILHAFTDTLQREGLTVERVRLPDAQRIDPATGAGLLLVEKKYYVDIAYAKHLTNEIIFECWKRVPFGSESFPLLIFNFGGAAPEYLSPPTDEELSDDEDNEAP